MNLDRENRADLVRDLLSSILLAALLVSIPILLTVAVGWPLPRGIPSGSEAIQAIKTGAVSPSVIVKAISIAVWIMWAQMLIGVGIEIWAHFRGAIAPRAGFIPSFVQRWSARMVATALVIAFSIQHPGVAMADNPELLAPTSVNLDTAEPRATTPHNIDVPTDPESETSSEPAPLIHTVERRDSLRMLATRYLGDPNRWTEVFILNKGQAQAKGGSLSDPARLQAGWELVMPADARMPMPTPPLLPTTVPSTQQPEPACDELQDSQIQDPRVMVEEGDTLWGLAAHHLDDPQRWEDIYKSNQDMIQDPDVIIPGWQLRLPTQQTEPLVLELPAPAAQQATDQTSPAPQPPPQPPPAPAPAPVDSAVSVLAYATPQHAVVASVPESKTAGETAPRRQTMLAVAGLGVFASGFGWVLARARRTRDRRLLNGRIPPSPSGGAIRLEHELQNAADPDGTLQLDAALRLMSSHIVGSPPPEIIGVSMNPSSISIHLGSPAEPPMGVDASSDSTTWNLRRSPATDRLLDEANAIPAPLPTLVTLGKADDAEFLLNLEHTAALDLQGDQEMIGEICAAMATQLASSHLADDLTVLCVGFGQDLEAFERVEYTPDVISAIGRIERQQRQNQALLGSDADLVGSRIGGGKEGWSPIVVLAPNRLSEDEASSLLTVPGNSVCVVAHGLDGAAWTAQFDHCGLLLQPIGLRLTPHGLSCDAVAAIAEVLWWANGADDAASLERQAPVLKHVARAAAPADPLNSASVQQRAASGPSVEIRVMGTVEAVGISQPFTSRRALDLVAYLAFHPAGADRDQLRTRIWPQDAPPSDSALSNALSRARKALGTNDRGEQYLPRMSAEGIYRLRPEVETDVDQFEALFDAARRETGKQGRDLLQTALGLVRGPAFTGSAGDMYRWADFGLRTRIDCLIDAAAHELAERCLAVGDSVGARSAAISSLSTVGLCEECYRWRLMAAANNPTEMRRVMSELMSQLKQHSGQAEADGLIDPHLLELYEKLMQQAGRPTPNTEFWQYRR